MRTHELAKALRELAQVLSGAPDVEVADLKPSDLRKNRQSMRKPEFEQFRGMFTLDKKQLVAFVDEFCLPIRVRPRDAGRDVLAKIQKYFTAHPDTWKKVSADLAHSRSPVSPALMSALNLLLRDHGETSTSRD